jgi:low temperature requirement protein LtrA
MPAGPHPADSLNHFQPDLEIPYDSISSGSALVLAKQSFNEITANKKNIAANFVGADQLIALLLWNVSYVDSFYRCPV